mgnify:CR=1 FL=1
MTPAELSALLAECEKLDRAATPGPWGGDANNVWRVDVTVADGMGEIICNHNRRGTGDAAYIARARTLLPQIAAACRDLMAQAAEATARAQRSELANLGYGQSVSEACAKYQALVDQANYRARGAEATCAETRAALLRLRLKCQQGSGNPEHDVDCGSCIEACRVLALDALKLKQEVKP